MELPNTVAMFDDLVVFHSNITYEDYLSNRLDMANWVNGLLQAKRAVSKQPHRRMLLHYHVHWGFLRRMYAGWWMTHELNITYNQNVSVAFLLNKDSQTQ
jgi:hypothetical protein